MENEIKDSCYLYLDMLRESGEINMFEAPRYLRDEFNLSKSDAISVFLEWSESKKEGI